MKIKISVDLKTNQFIRNLMFADLALFGGWGLIAPVFSIFVIDRVEGATLVTVGTGAAIYWILKSLLQIPVANFLDRSKGEESNFKVLITGLLLAAATAFLFTLARQIWAFYAVQALQAVAFGLYIPSWSAIFSRHLDKDRISFDWSLDSTAVGLSAGIAGFVGGAIANWLGFNGVFVFAALLSLVSAFIVFFAPSLVFPKKTGVEPIIKDHTPTDVRQ